jgi:drug/metabolite transporter (DMT)-like permease
MLLLGILSHGQWLPINATAKAWGLLVVSGVSGYCLADVFVIKAFAVIGPRMTLLLQSIAPPLVAVGGFFYLGESLTAINVLGIVITMAGIMAVVLEKSQLPKGSLRKKDLAMGIVLACMGAIVGSVSILFAKRGVDYVDPLAANQMRTLSGLVCCLPMLTVAGRWPQIDKAIRCTPTLLVVLCGTLLGPVLGMGLFFYALKACNSAGIVCTISSMTPVLILPFSVFYFKERVSFRAMLGAAISVLGIALLMC